MVDHIDENSNLTQLYRQELEDYLDNINSKTDSDGNALIIVPKNFNEIVNAMTREDLLDSENSEREVISHEVNVGDDTDDRNGRAQSNSSSKKTALGEMKASWYKYLLADSTNEAMNREYEGRYSDILLTKPRNHSAQSNAIVDEDQIKKGLAEIFYLDRELWKLNKQIKMINSRPVSSSAAENNDEVPDDEQDQEPSEMLTSGQNEEEAPSSQSQSVPSTPKDVTFVTRRYDSGFGEQTVPSSRKESVTPRQAKPPVSARSQHSVPSSARSVPSEKVESQNRDKDGVDESSDEDASPSKVSQTRPFKKLTAAQESLVEEILARPDAFYEDEETVLTHYYDATLLEEHRRLDSSLQQFDHLDRLAVGKDAEELKVLLEIQKKKDYLAQQLLERKERQYENKINKLLALSAQKTVDLEAFFLCDEQDAPASSSPSVHTTSSTKTGRSKFSQNLAELPSTVDEIHAQVPITQQDVQLLIRNLKEQFSRRGTGEDSSQSPGATAETFEKGENEANNLNLNLASKEEIAALTSQFQVEIIQLANLRHQVGRPSSAATQLSADSSNNHWLRDQRCAIYDAIEDDALGLLDVHNLPYYHQDIPSAETEDALEDNNKANIPSFNFDGRQKHVPLKGENSGTRVEEEKPFSSSDLQQLSDLFALEQQHQSQLRYQPKDIARLVMPIPPPEQEDEKDDDITHLKLPRIPSASSSSNRSARGDKASDNNYHASRILTNRRVKPSVNYQSPRNIQNTANSPSTRRTAARSSADWEEVVPSRRDGDKTEDLIEHVRKFVSC